MTPPPTPKRVVIVMAADDHETASLRAKVRGVEARERLTHGYWLEIVEIPHDAAPE